MTSTKIVSALVACSALLSFSAVASAQSARSDTVIEKGGPSRAMLFSGLGTFGVSYGAAVAVAATSDLDADHRMFVPLAGPWMALSNRGPCGAGTPRTCDAQTTGEVLIVADGVFQALGALLVVESFFNPETISETRSSEVDTTIHFAPSVGSSGYGLAAFGNF